MALSISRFLAFSLRFVDTSPFLAAFVVDFKAGMEVVTCRWRASEILGAVKEGARNLLMLDPFADIDPLETGVEDIITVDSFPEPGHIDVIERNIDSESEFEYQEEDDEDSEEDENEEETNEVENKGKNRNVIYFLISKC